MTKKDIFRVSAEFGLIDFKDLDKWFLYHKAMDSSSHIYDISMLDEVYNIAEEFLLSAKEFLKRLKEKNN